MPPAPTPADPDPGARPAPVVPLPLKVSAVLAAAEGLVLLLVGVAELLSLTGGRLTMGLTTAFFFVASGGGLIACGVGLVRARAWSRGPVLLAQVMALVGAWSVREAFPLVAVLLAAAALATLGGLVHPASTAALDGHDEEHDDQSGGSAAPPPS